MIDIAIIPENMVLINESIDSAIDEGGMILRIVKDVADRSGKQNRLSHILYSYIAMKTGDMTDDEVKCECKYRFGIPIILKYYPEIGDMYRKIFINLTREDRVKAMSLIPLTSTLNVSEMAEYLDSIYKHYNGLGFMLPEPSELFYKAMGNLR